MRIPASILACVACWVTAGLAAASAAPPAGGAASKRCTSLAGELVKQTRFYDEDNLPRGVNASSTPICFDFTGDGLRDVAFGILSGGTAGPTHWAAFSAVETDDGQLSARYRKVAERMSGSKTRLLRRGRRLAVQTPIYARGDANCCPTGGATRLLYRVEQSRVVRVGKRRLTRREAGQTG